jgi:RND family efflux transporter MFP subunit
MRGCIPILIAIAGMGCSSVRTAVRDADVEIVPVRTGVVSRTVTLNGTVFPRGRSAVWAKTSGRIERIYVQRGDFVTTGQAMVGLDATRARADLEQRRVGVLRAKTFASRARLDDTGLRVVDEAVLERDLADEQLRQAEVRQAERNVQEALTTLDAHIIRAPFPGRVIQVNLKVGQIIAPGAVESASYLAVASATGMQIDVEGDEFEVASLKPGMAAKVKVDAIDLECDAVVVGEPLLARLRSPGLTSSQYAVRLESSTEVPPLAWGMTARVQFEVSQGADTPVIPHDAVVSKDGALVALVEHGTSFEVRVLRLGLCDQARCEVLAGLAPSTRVARGPSHVLLRLARDAPAGSPNATQVAR